MPQMAHNPDRNFSADSNAFDARFGLPKSELDRLFDDPVIRERIARLISSAMRRAAGLGG